MAFVSGRIKFSTFVFLGFPGYRHRNISSSAYTATSCCLAFRFESSETQSSSLNLGRKMININTHGVRNRRTSCSTVKTIGTHDGCFHCDEVLACVMLRLLPEYNDAHIIRTRDKEILDTCDVVVDVGGVYDASRKRFDHHQRSFEETFNSLKPDKPFTTKLSSAGLIYVHYGEEVLAQILSKNKHDEVVKQLYDKMYKDFVEEIDAIDNGISLNDFPMRYTITSALSHRVSRLNPSWRDPRPDAELQFQKALQLVGSEFIERVHNLASDWWEAYSLVKSAVESRFETDSSGEIIELSQGGCPWKGHLFQIEQDMEIDPSIKFAIYPDHKGLWRVQGMSIDPESFTLRIPLKQEWRGLRDKELQEVSNIPTAIFVHSNGFIGGASERECVLQMARMSMENA